ncbi:MAG: FMN-binding protein [Zhongshania sp.]|uniref:FMN-binding protein n=1 Tax=Zhongshania sp. TaxID=1971902 RepID=UPI00262894DB|nr:FMN-binding protein [Zhongshania sp.]MDF1692086.1 FMN-binding protein [Zhongshania sp.]
MPAVVFGVLLILQLMAMPPVQAASVGQYLTVDEFLGLGFSDNAKPEPKVLWLTPELKAQIKSIRGKDFPLLRVRYWRQGQKTAWILEEIGKEMPITIGVVVDAGGASPTVARVEILAFRESRGWEVRHDFFTEQFRGAALTDSHLLSQHIDGITGATLSVRAVKQVALIALLLADAVKPMADPNAAE